MRGVYKAQSTSAGGAEAGKKRATRVNELRATAGGSAEWVAGEQDG